MLGKTVLFQGKDYIDQLRRFVAILGKPTLELFPDLDPIAVQGLSRVFKDIPDRDKVDWKFLFPRVRYHWYRQAKRLLTCWIICWSMIRRHATLLNNAWIILFWRTLKVGLEINVKRFSIFRLIRLKWLFKTWGMPYTKRLNPIKKEKDVNQSPSIHLIALTRSWKPIEEDQKEKMIDFVRCFYNI